jgi:uncharacterized protein (DUF2147 family)
MSRFPNAKRALGLLRLAPGVTALMLSPSFSTAMAAGQRGPEALSSIRHIVGQWQTADGKSVIEIYPCGSSICGKVVKALVPAPATDENNPDASLRSRPFIGTPVLSDFSYRNGVWEGRIYNPRAGKIYRSKISSNTDGTLLVKGCVSFICVGQNWPRVRG